MKFREIVESPCGIRYLFDELRLQSGFARKVLLDREMMTDAAAIGRANASLRTYIDLVDRDRRRVEDLSFLVFQFDRQRVKVRRFRAPRPDAGELGMGEIPDPGGILSAGAVHRAMPDFETFGAEEAPFEDPARGEPFEAAENFQIQYAGGKVVRQSGPGEKVADVIRPR